VSANKAFFSTFSTQNSVVNQLKIEQKLTQAPSAVHANPVKAETGGMFKKKNPYLSD
jgi:hypothetical protein